MSALTINFELEDSLAATWQATNESERTKIQQRVQHFMEKLLREQAKTRLFSIMEELQKTASANGLTDEILEEILAENG